MNEKILRIKEDIIKIESNNPFFIIKTIMNKDYINIHGPEHHFLDGAAFLVAYYNLTKSINLKDALNKLEERSLKMPGAMCGFWGVCGAVASLGASLSIIHEVTPLSSTSYYADNLLFSSLALNELAKIGGPRCCKRNAFTALKNAVKFINEKYDLNMPLENIKCDYFNYNYKS